MGGRPRIRTIGKIGRTPGTAQKKLCRKKQQHGPPQAFRSPSPVLSVAPRHWRDRFTICVPSRCRPATTPS